MFSKTGDSYFRSGDILHMDKYGWLYFVDRLGDTYRWKGENVSTTQVEGVINKIASVPTTSYGVTVDGYEGRAGMIVLPKVEDKNFLPILYNGIEQNLPSYARPIFLRFVPDMESEMTGTFKLKKYKWKNQGFDPENMDTNDELYFRNARSKSFVKLDSNVYNKIINFEINL